MPDRPERPAPARTVVPDGGSDDPADDGADDRPDDTMGERMGGTRLRMWFLLTGNRWAVTALLSLSIFVALVVPSLLGVGPMRQVIREQTALWWVFSPLIGAVITGVTFVVTFTQLVLSQELGPLGDQRDRMQGAMQFREDVGPYLDVSPPPSDPARFLAALLGGVDEHAGALRAAAKRHEDDEARAQIVDFAESMRGQSRAVSEGLDDASFGEFDVLRSALDFNYSWKIHEAGRLHDAHAGELDGDTEEALDELVSALEFFGPAREHFKTLYFQWELVDLSRMILTAALPALAVAFLVQLYVSPSTLTGTYLGLDALVWVVAAGITIALVPFFLLAAYVLRIATIAKRTLAIGPFVLRDTDRAGERDPG